MSDRSRAHKGTSLAKGPAFFIGLASLALGILGFLFADQSFTNNPLDGTVNGSSFLGIEGNGWTWALFAAGGLLLLLAAPMHWGAKTMALIVGLAFGAASVISLVDGNDVFGIFAANGLTKLVLGRRRGRAAADRAAPARRQEEAAHGHELRPRHAARAHRRA
jgi:hypothetical protein